jgi:hypothetical protein
MINNMIRMAERSFTVKFYGIKDKGCRALDGGCWIFPSKPQGAVKLIKYI